MNSDAQWLVGRGIADITGDPWDVGMMGYGMRWQRTTGIHLRQRSRAFVLVDRASGRRVAYVVADIGMFFHNVRDAVLARLDPRDYRADNVVLTATHTHAGVGGYSGYRLYNTSIGFQPPTYAAIVDGVVASIEQAHADLAPGRVLLSRGELHDASVNRSPESFALNPQAERAHFPGRVDPATTLLRLERDGRLVGAINWFATHGTSLTNRNTLVSGDNKGYAAYRWERELAGGDYLGELDVVTAFAQTNAGDMSPNLPDATQGPTGDEFANVRIVGERQCSAAVALAAGPGRELAGALDTRLAYVDLPGLVVQGEFTPDGRPHRTGRAVLGAAFAAGTKEGLGVSFCHHGVGTNPLLDTVSGLAYRVMPRLGDAQAPKAMLIPSGMLGWTATRLPVHLVRIGPLVLVGLAHEVTIVAGLRLRRAVADVLGADVEDVLVQGYANDYAGYLTTPEEYAAQRYEGGHTMFGRWQLPAYLQEVTRVAAALRDGDTAGGARPRPVRPPRTKAPDLPAPRVLRVSREPQERYAVDDVVAVEFALTDPRSRLLPAYAVVEVRDGNGWRRVADDGDWSTTVAWRKEESHWTAGVAWRVTPGSLGEHRICYRTGLDSTPSRSFDIA